MASDSSVSCVLRSSRERMRRRAVRTLLVLPGLFAGAVAACPLTPADGQSLAGDAVALAWSLSEGVIKVSDPFVLEVRACPAGTELVAVDAQMPAHRHGMNYHPSIQAIGTGHWRVKGLIWHMAGHWELNFDLRHEGRTQRLRQAVQLK